MQGVLAQRRKPLASRKRAPDPLIDQNRRQAGQRHLQRTAMKHRNAQQGHAK